MSEWIASFVRRCCQASTVVVLLTLCFLRSSFASTASNISIIPSSSNESISATESLNESSFISYPSESYGPDSADVSRTNPVVSSKYSKLLSVSASPWKGTPGIFSSVSFGTKNLVDTVHKSMTASEAQIASSTQPSMQSPPTSTLSSTNVETTASSSVPSSSRLHVDSSTSTMFATLSTAINVSSSTALSQISSSNHSTASLNMSSTTSSENIPNSSTRATHYKSSAFAVMTSHVKNITSSLTVSTLQNSSSRILSSTTQDAGASVSSIEIIGSTDTNSTFFTQDDSSSTWSQEISNVTRTEEPTSLSTSFINATPSQPMSTMQPSSTIPMCWGCSGSQKLSFFGWSIPASLIAAIFSM